MRYWDASALVPLFFAEPSSERMEAVAREDPAIVTWWGTRIECFSVVSQLEREGVLSAASVARATEKLRRAGADWTEVHATEELRHQAERMLRVHPLRAADALQLAAAVIAAEHRPPQVEFVTLDRRLADAARREGFGVLGIVG